MNVLHSRWFSNAVCLQTAIRPSTELQEASSPHAHPDAPWWHALCQRFLPDLCIGCFGACVAKGDFEILWLLKFLSSVHLILNIKSVFKSSQDLEVTTLVCVVCSYGKSLSDLLNTHHWSHLPVRHYTKQLVSEESFILVFCPLILKRFLPLLYSNTISCLSSFLFQFLLSF